MSKTFCENLDSWAQNPKKRESLRVDLVRQTPVYSDLNLCAPGDRQLSKLLNALKYVFKSHWNAFGLKFQIL